MHLLLCILDVDECATNNGGCSVHAVCTNTVGSRTCKCKAGYSGDGVTCNGMRVVKCLQICVFAVVQLWVVVPYPNCMAL